MTNTIDLSNTDRAFALGSGVYIEILDGTISQVKIEGETKTIIKSFAASQLTTQQAEAITRARIACAAARKSQGWDK